MCGIAGIVSINSSLSNLADQVNVVNMMTNALAHRGPDNAGLWNDNYCVLGHRRLSILDLTKAGSQPMCSGDDSQLYIVFNGEIYNHLELKDTLVYYGHQFKSETDTEVLLRSYEQWGVECVKKLSGMFAFAIWDKKIRRLLLARDRVGKKPLFYAINNGILTFASELQAILKNPIVSRDYDWQGIDNYLSYGYIPAPRSGYASIRKLEPAQIAVIEWKKSINIERYWSLPYEPKAHYSEEDAVNELRVKLTSAVRARMMSHVPVGAFLSGGIDSSIIVGLMAQLQSRPVKTFSIGFNDQRFDELGYAQMVAKKWSTEHTELHFTPDFFNRLPLLIRHFGEPFADISALPLTQLSEFTSSNVKVVLTGDGGDESFAGYDRYVANKLAQQINKIRGVNEALKFSDRLVQYLGQRTSHAIFTQSKASRILRSVSLPLRSRYTGWLTYFTPAQKRELCNDFANMQHDDYLGKLIDLKSDLADLDIGMAVDVLSYLPGDLLVKLDIATMMHGLEARSPFLDQAVMEFAATLPTKFKASGQQTKIILKKAFGDLLPEKVQTRSKMGFGVPIGEWFRGPLKGLLYSSLIDVKSQIFRKDIVERYINDHIARKHDYSFQLWNLLVVNIWLDSNK